MILCWGVHSDKIGNVYLKKTRVGFGRTEVSVRLDGIVVCALSSGHGPRGRGLEGVWKSLDFHDLCGGSKVTE